VLAITLFAAFSQAAPRVALVSQAAKTAVSERYSTAWHQLRAELEADGFEVIVVGETKQPSPAMLEAFARSSESFAALRLTETESGLTADVWIENPGTGKTLLHQLSAQGGSREAGRELALRTAELLGASVLVLSLSTGNPPVRRELGAWVGGAVFGHPGGLSTGAGVALGGYWHATQTLSMELRLVLPIFGNEATTLGAAETDQELALLGLRVESQLGDPLFVLASVGFGGYRVAVRGNPFPPLAARSEAQIVAAAAFGAGIGLRILRRPGFDLKVVLREDVVALMPRPVILFANAPLAKAGQPMLVASGGLEMVW
jgi:hypothetical protein